MGEFDDLLGDVIAEVPAITHNEYAEPSGARAADAIDVAKQVFDDELMNKFIVQTATVPFEGISDAIISQGYAFALWRFREAAIAGDIDKTRALKIWLDWAEPNVKSRKNTGDHIENSNASNFLPREVK